MIIQPPAALLLNIQTMSHPVLRFAHHMTKVLWANRIFLRRRYQRNTYRSASRKNLSEKQQKENQEAVHHAWRIGYNHTMHSLVNGFYQGWDLNLPQLPMRYAATYNFFLSSYENAVFSIENIC